MSAITVERPFVKAEKPTTQPANGACTRKEEFHAALDSYMAHYAAEQANRLSVIGSSNNPYALVWLRRLRRLLKARRLGCFSNERVGMAAPEVRSGARFEMNIFRKPHEARSTFDVGVSLTRHTDRSMSALEQ